MWRGWLVVVVSLFVLSIVSCGESKLARAKRMSRGRAPDDPPGEVAPTNVPQPPAPANSTQNKPAATVASPTSPAAAPLNPAPTTPGPPVPPSQVATSNVPQPPPIGPVVIDIPRPVTPLTPEERRARSLQNLTAIATALEGYMQNSNSVPSQAFTDENTQAPLLSWRVALLPQLGHGKLYSQFKLDQRWDSPHNRQLLKQIPPEFLSPERFDEKTCYLCPVGPAVAMSPTANRSFTQFKDGMANTIMLVEVDDAHAVPWTQPNDWPVNLESPQAGLGKVRGDGFFAVLANTSLVKVPATTPAEQVRALFTFAGGDGPKAIDIVQDPAGGALPGAAVATAPTSPPLNPLEKPHVTPPSAAPGSIGAPAASSDLPAITALLSPEPPAREGLSPVPAAGDLKTAKDRLREVYGKDYAAAKQPEEKSRLAKQLIDDAATLQQNHAEKYELLRIAKDLAVQAGDVSNALRAAQALEAAFAVDGLRLRAKTLSELQAGRNARWDALAPEARKLLQESLQQCQFDAAVTVQELLLSSARAQNDKVAINQANELRERIDAAQLAYANIPAALSTLAQQPADPRACEVVGEYLCLVRHRWDLGLPLLAKSENIKLRFVASIDLEAGKTAPMLVQLGDAYWQLAEEKKSPHGAALQARAAHWYSQAVPQLAGGLDRIKVQKRLQEIVTNLGQDQIELLAGNKLAATFTGASPATGRPDPNARFE